MPVPKHHVRINVVLHEFTAASLSNIAHRMGVTRSEVLEQIIGEPLVELSKVFDLIPKDAPATASSILEAAQRLDGILTNGMRDAREARKALRSEVRHDAQ